MIIALRDNDTVWVGVTAEKAHGSIHINDVVSEDNLNLWRVEGLEDCIIASLYAGGIDLDLLKYEKDIGLNTLL